MKTKQNKVGENGRSLVAPPLSPTTNVQPLAVGHTLYFTAAQVRSGEVDLSPLHAYVPASLVVNLLASLPVVVNHIITTPTAVQSATLPILKGA